MGLLSLFAITTRVLNALGFPLFGQSIFLLEFEGLILYLPTALLLTAVLYDWVKNRSRPKE